MTTAAVGAPGSPRRYLHSLWLLSARDLRVRYATSALGYLWSVLDPLVMSLIYWFVFTQVFGRGVGEEPYIVFLITALLPWVWFNAAVSDFTRAFNKDARLVRSTAIPRSIWVNRIVLSKGIEFLFSIPVLALFAIISGATVGWGILLVPCRGAPADRAAGGSRPARRAAVRAVLRPGAHDEAHPPRALLRIADHLRGLRPARHRSRSSRRSTRSPGIFTLYRVGFFPDQWDTFSVVIGAVISFAFLGLGILVFRRLERPVLKEL